MVDRRCVFEVGKYFCDFIGKMRFGQFFCLHFFSCYVCVAKISHHTAFLAVFFALEIFLEVVPVLVGWVEISQRLAVLVVHLLIVE